MVNIKELQKERIAYLRRLYELADASELTLIPIGDVEHNLGLDSDKATKIQVYLLHRHFLDLTTTHVRITNLGIQEVERLAAKDQEKKEEPIGRPSTVAPAQGPTDIEKGSVFIIMSMDKTDPLLEDVHVTIKRVCRTFDLHAERAADIEHSESVTDLIVERLKKAQILIGDLTGERPNVYYELGFAHGLGRTVNLYSRKDTKIHFDVHDFNVKSYENVTELENMLRSRLNAILTPAQGHSDEDAKLRRALYDEMIGLASSIGGQMNYHKDKCAIGETDYMKNPNRGKVTAPLSFRVYESLTKDPVAFHQLEEASSIDFAYDRLRSAYNLLQMFEKNSIDSAKEAKRKCTALIGLYKTSLSAIDAVFNFYKRILQELDDGRFVKKWNALKGLEEANFGPIDQDRQNLF
jgi:hypothetical protein